MKRILLTTATAALLSISAAGLARAEIIGVSFHTFDDNFITVLKNGMLDHVKTLDGVNVQVENAQGDVGRQLDQINNFIASGVDAIVVLPVDTNGTQALSDAAEKAGIPLVYVNREPVNVGSLPDNQAFIASNEVDSGTLETTEVCRLLKEAGKGSGANIAVLQGELGNFAARTRTQDIKDVIATPECSFMKIVEDQTGNWQRVQATDIVTNWLSAGTKFDAIIANNDEMAIGAIQALKSAGVSTKDVLVAGIDATQDGLAAMKAGDLAVTVFQDAAGQGAGGIDAALKLARKQAVEQKVYIPFQLVTPANMADFATAN